MATTEMNSEESSRRSLLDEPELKDWIRPTSESWTAGDKATEINHGPPPSFAALCREGVVASELCDHHAYYTQPSFYGAFTGLRMYEEILAGLRAQDKRRVGEEAIALFNFNPFKLACGSLINGIRASSGSFKDKPLAAFNLAEAGEGANPPVLFIIGAGQAGIPLPVQFLKQLTSSVYTFGGVTGATMKANQYLGGHYGHTHTMAFATAGQETMLGQLASAPVTSGGGTGATVNIVLLARLLIPFLGNHHADIFTAQALVEAVKREVSAALGLEAIFHQLVQPLTSGHTFGYGGAGNIETFLGGQHAFTRASQGLLARHILAEASDAVAVQLNDEMLLEAAASRAAAQVLGFDEAGGRFLAIDVDAQQQEKGDQDFVVASRTINDGLRDLAQRILQSLLGGLVPLSLTFLHDACKDDCPKYIKLVAYTGLGVVTGLTYLGLILEKRAKAAVRVAASTSIAAVTIAAVLQVHNVYGQCIVGILGATGTLATAALSW